MTQHAHTQSQLHVDINSRPASLLIYSDMEVRAYFETAQRRGDAYNNADTARADVLSILRRPENEELTEHCEKIAQRLAATARECSCEKYWWSTRGALNSPYRLSDLDHLQSPEELTSSLQELCERLMAPDASLFDLAPVLALMSMEVLRLSAAHHRLTTQQNRRPQHTDSA